MKIRKNYILFVNEMQRTAFYGGKKFDARISKATLGEIFDCSFRDLKNNIKKLKELGFKVSQRKW